MVGNKLIEFYVTQYKNFISFYSFLLLVLATTFRPANPAGKFALTELNWNNSHNKPLLPAVKAAGKSWGCCPPQSGPIVS